MLLSRLAEHIYWAGRYLERAEDTARLVKVQTELFLDLPSSVSLGWTPLLAVTGSHDAYDAYTDEGVWAGSEELQVVSFLTTARDNPSSVLSCIAAARQNLRAVRSLIPRSGWEQVNHLHLWAGDTQSQASPRRSRAEWADGVMRRCQTITGILDGTMSHDTAFTFLLLGRHLERADMTTRVLDVQASTMLEDIEVAGSAYADVTWMAVLKSVSAMQMYRRAARAGVSGSRALNFLLTDLEFPRSVSYLLWHLDNRLARLPHNTEAMQAVRRAQRRIDRANLDASLAAMAPADLHEFMDKLQTDLGAIHDAAKATWFDTIGLPGAPEHDSSTSQQTSTQTSEQHQWQSMSP